MPDYTDSVTNAFERVYARFIDFVPSFIVAVIVLVLGWLLAAALARLVKTLLQSLRMDELGTRLGLKEMSSATNMRISVSGFVAGLVKWFLIVVVFLAAADILNLNQITEFLNRVLVYIPNVVAAAAILLVGSVVAGFLARLVTEALAAAKYASAGALGSITRWAVMIFTILATLDQLKVAQAFVQTLFTGIIAMLAIAGGIAFGLGGRDHAKQALDNISRDLTRRT